MADTFSWGGETWGAGELGKFKAYLAAHGGNYDDWSGNHPGAAAILEGSAGVPYNPNAYVPGGSSPAVSQAIQDQGYAEPGPNPVYVPQGVGPELPLGGESQPPSGGGGGATAAAPKAPAPTDWSQALSLYGITDQSIIDQLGKIWASSLNADGTINVTQALEQAMSFVRGTSWYKTAYAGIDSGIAAGLFTDERGYMSYRNQLDQLYSQYYGRVSTGTELSAYLSGGKSISQVSNQLQSAALSGTVSDPLKAVFTPAELQAFNDERAGIDTPLGQQISQQANLAASVNLLYQNFYGRGITRSELDNLTKNGLDGSAVAQQFATQAATNALNPAVAGLFTADEIHQMALQAAGGTTPNGQQLTDMASLAAQLNQVYQTYHGTQVTRDELNQAYQQGMTAQQVANGLQTGTILGSLPDYLGGLFTPDELHQIAAQQSGQTDTAQGRTLANLAQNADAYNQVFQTYMGRNISRDELAGYVNGDVTAGKVGQQLAAGQFAGSLPAQVASLFTPEELAAAGAQSTGAAQTTANARLLNIVQQAGSYNAVARQYTGANIDRGVLENLYDTGVSPSTYANQQQGAAYVNANRGDIQQTSGAFGTGLLTEDQLKSLGEETAGIDTSQGQSLATQFQKAQQRMAGVFKGVLATPAVASLTRRASASPDVGA